MLENQTQKNQILKNQAIERQIKTGKINGIRKAELSDLPEIAALESEIFSDAWSLKSLEQTWNQKNAEIFVAKTEGKIAGYLIFYYVLDEGEIARIATDPSLRRQGAAGRMFGELVSFCEERQITRILLEVRESNESARGFYEKCGFAEDGIRKNYYENPKENAILMSKNL